MNENTYKREELDTTLSLDKLNGITLDEIKSWIKEQENKYPDHFKLRLNVAWIECEPVIKLIGTRDN